MSSRRVFTLGSLVILLAIAVHAVCSFQGQGEDIDLFLEGMAARPTYPMVDEEIQLNVTAFTDTNGTNYTVIEIYEGPKDGGPEELIHRAELQAVNDKGFNVEFTHIWTDNQTGERNLRAVIDVENNVTETNENNNELNFTVVVQVERLAELNFDVDTPIQIDPSDPNVEAPLVNHTISIQISIINLGRAPADSFQVQVMEIYEDETPVQLNLSQFNGVGEEQILMMTMNWTPDRVGEYRIRVTLDVDDETVEYLEDNNVLEENVTIRPHLARLTIDVNTELILTPVNDWLEDLPPYADHNFTLEAYIVNEDTEAQVRNIRVDFYDHHVPSDETYFIGTGIIPFLDAAPEEGPQPEIVSVNWGYFNGTSLLGDHDLSVVIDPLNTIPEYDEEDNTYNQTFRLRPPKADLVAISLEPAGDADQEPAEGIYTPLNLTLANLGSLDLFEILIKVDDYGEFTYLNVTLLEGEYKTLTFDHYWVRSGLRPITIVVDPYNDLHEIDENNTFFADDYLTVHTRVVDFSLASIEHRPSIFENDDLEVKVFVQNHKARVEDIEIERFHPLPDQDHRAPGLPKERLADLRAGHPPGAGTAQYLREGPLQFHCQRYQRVQQLRQLLLHYQTQLLPAEGLPLRLHQHQDLRQRDLHLRADRGELRGTDRRHRQPHGPTGRQPAGHRGCGTGAREQRGVRLHPGVDPRHPR